MGEVPYGGGQYIWGRFRGDISQATPEAIRLTDDRPMDETREEFGFIFWLYGLCGPHRTYNNALREPCTGQAEYSPKTRKSIFTNGVHVNFCIYEEVYRDDQHGV